ncbi:MAG: sulfurtransferase-like selenium metabolism protein YedF, partial [Desulfobacteraceae bacterium]
SYKKKKENENMTQMIDCRGIACPGPVLKAKEAIEQPGNGEVALLVDNDAAVENVSRFITSRGFEVSVEQEKNGASAVKGRKKNHPVQKGVQPAPEQQEESDHQKIMVMIASSTIGRGDEQLGKKLMLSYIKTLKEMGKDLWRLVFVNDGVKFAVKGSSLLPDLKAFQKEGVHILVCGTCLTHFDLLEAKEVGETTNMLDIVTAMQLADKVINL